MANTSELFIADFIEEALQGVGVFALGGPDHPLALMIDHDSHVVVTFTVAELIDADGLQALESPLIEAFGNHALDNVADTAPTDAEQLLDLALVGNLGQI